MTRMNALGLALAIAFSASLAQAQSAPASPAKKEMIAKIVQLQQPMAELLARNIVQQPLGPLMQSAGQALQQVPADKREATGKAMEAEVKKFVEENIAYVKDKASKMAPTTTSAILDERFTEDELRQVLAWFESPVSKKFGQVNGELQKALFDKVVAEAGPTLEGRFKTLQTTLAKQMGLQPPAAAPAKPASAAKK